jgi:vanillate monooxygenase
MLEAQQRAIEANPGYDFYNLNIDAAGMWTRRLVQRMIDAESGTDTGGTQNTSGAAAVAAAAAVAQANARMAGNGGTGVAAEVANDVARHRDEPAAGLMQRGL